MKREAHVLGGEKEVEDVCITVSQRVSLNGFGGRLKAQSEPGSLGLVWVKVLTGCGSY